MTNAELAAFLNFELQLSGAAIVTSDVVRQWVLWDVLPPASGRGRGYARGLHWRRSERDMKRARQLAEWRAAGVTLQNAVIVHAFVAWGHPDWKRVRDALSSEMRRARGAIAKRLTTDLTFSDFSEVSASRRRAYRKQLGPLDHRFTAADLEASSELYALAAQIMHGDSKNMRRLIEISKEYLVSLSPQTIPEADAAGARISNAIIGLIASPDESDQSAVATIDTCREHQLRTARVWYRQIEKAISSLSITASKLVIDNSVVSILSDLKGQITNGHWLAVALAAILNIIRGEERRDSSVL